MKIVTGNSSSHDSLIRFISPMRAERLTDFEGKSGSSCVRYEDDKRVVYIGTGEDDFTTTALRDAVAGAVRLLSAQKIETLSIELPEESYTAAAVEGAVLGDYLFDKYLTEKRVHLTDLELINGDESAIAQAYSVAQGVCLARDLINENAEIVTPPFLADTAKEIADSCDEMSVEILTEKEIVEKGLGLLWAVGKGSATPPRLAIISYKGNPDSEESIALVGKGVTFDTGGLNLKPTGSMETMRSDMSGAAAVLGTMKMLAEQKPKINVFGVVTSAQNAISNTAYYTGDIVTGYDGTTVEVLNTDAEGRLCLADAISYVKKNYEPTRLINIATLTGAVVIALGDTIAGLFSNNPEFKDELFEIGETTGESLWELPIRKEHHEQMKSSIADLQNIGKKARNASSITAGAFLQHFVGDTPWCHVDIAGVAWNSGEPSGIKNKFATGFGVRLFSELLLK